MTNDNESPARVGRVPAFICATCGEHERRHGPEAECPTQQPGTYLTSYFKYDEGAASNERVPAWVPVSDRLPTRVGEECIVLSSTGYRTSLDYAGDGRWRALDPRENDDYWTKFVTHWMPMPEAPK